MSVSYGELLKKRALAFLESAEVSLERGHYDLVLFNVEQSLQLYLKYLLYRRLGDFPKTHSLVRLLKEVAKVYSEEELRKLYEQSLETLYLLEEAYISSRHVPRTYDREIAERVLEFAKKAIEVFQCVESRR